MAGDTTKITENTIEKMAENMAEKTAGEAAQGAGEASYQEAGLTQVERSVDSGQQEIDKLRAERDAFRADAEKYREIQDAEKTELQRVQEALEQERATSKRFEVELARSRALSKYGICEENADLLGSDPEKFDDNAKRLGELQTQASRRGAPPSDYPVEDMKPGASDKQDEPDFGFPSSWPVNGKFVKVD